MSFAARFGYTQPSNDRPRNRGKSGFGTSGFVHLDRDTCTENDWWAYRATVDSAERGYVHEQGAVWDPEGRLAAYSRQTATVFG